jgi:hypothetical protein
MVARPVSGERDHGDELTAGCRDGCLEGFVVRRARIQATVWRHGRKGARLELEEKREQEMVSGRKVV